MPPVPSAPASRAWLDEGEVSPAWTAPDSSAGRTVRPVVVYLALLLALALVVGLVAGLGGFRRRTDVFTTTPVGTTVSTGPYELRFPEATVQQRTDYKNQVTWRVEVVGEGRTTGVKTIEPEYSGNDSMFVAKDAATQEVELPTGQTFREGSAKFGGGFTPGLPPQPFAVQFDFRPTYRPGREIVFVVYELEFRDTSLLRNQDPTWHNTVRGYRFQVPLRVLPPQVS